MLPTSSLEYDLPERLVADRPAEPRDSARLLVISRSDPGLMEHRRFGDLPEYLRRGDALVVNRSWVVPARFFGLREETGGKVEGLFLSEEERGGWTVMLQSGGRLREGVRVRLRGQDGTPGRFMLVLEEKRGEVWRVRLEAGDGPQGDAPPGAMEVLTEVGVTPLPPYIVNTRRTREQRVEDASDRRWYQAVYADEGAPGSVAAPTAGLHFTPGLLARLDEAGVERGEVLLAVGAGTFKPVQTDFVEQHDMHEEACRVPGETLGLIERTRARGGRVVAVGTTTVRALESVPDQPAGVAPPGGFSGRTRLLITPGFRFRRTDSLITNFHLPRSTLLALVAALLPEGVDRLQAVYREAVRLEYRFYSYGDAMLLLP